LLAMNVDPNHKVDRLDDTLPNVMGNLGWRCDHCDTILWAAQQPARPSECPSCGRTRFSATEVWRERRIVNNYAENVIGWRPAFTG
jgi:rubrerythrin